MILMKKIFSTVIQVLILININSPTMNFVT